MSDRERGLNTAAVIGRRLCGEAVWSGGQCNWLGDAMEFVDNDWRVVHRTCGPALYDGTSGIALFLARLYQAAGDPLLRTTARAALRHAFGQMSFLPKSGRLGLYSGLPGIAYAASEAGAAMDDDEWRERSRDLLGSLTAESDDGESLDIIGGAAGAIPLLLHQEIDGSRQLAIALGERLLGRARRDNGVASWRTMPTPGGQGLTGYSHGASGIGVALLELGMATGEERFLSTAWAAIEYERRHFLADQGNWPDFRTLAERSCAIAWCHGAPGIGLARLRIHQLTSDAGARKEAEISLRTTHEALEYMMGGAVMDFSLCHGATGLAEVFLSAREELGDPAYGSIANRVGALGIERFAAPGLPWPCGVPNGGETPALLTGLAGIGYFYLRLALGNQLPSVLLIEGPGRPSRPSLLR